MAHVLVTGASGLIGRELVIHLLKNGHTVTAVGRSDPAAFARENSLPISYLCWKEPETEPFPKDGLQSIDAIVHLMGEPISGRWTRAKKQRVRDSRVLPTTSLARALQTHIAAGGKAPVIVAASAIGFYGHVETGHSTEQSACGHGFLSEVCQEWEQATAALPSSRLVTLRIGIVLAAGAATLGAMEPIFNSYVSSPLGNGRQRMSWIHLTDLVRIICTAIERPEISGTLNATAPTPVTNREFTAALAHALHAPSFLPAAPGAVIKLALGEMSALVLEGQSALPVRLQNYGFEFKFPTLEGALAEIYAWKQSAQDQLAVFKAWVPGSLEQIFKFFSDEKNLEVITPPWLNFKVLKKSTPHLSDGTLIDYSLRIHGVPARWRTLISKWNPPHEFQDSQLRGPYARWDHTHQFEVLRDGVLMTDRVAYRVPLGLLGRTVLGKFISRDVQTIFGYRSSVLKKTFASPPPR